MAIPYVPFKDSSKEIRLLVLKATTDNNAPLKAKLFHAELDSAYYVALSYVWGDPDDNRVDIEIQYEQILDSGNTSTVRTSVGINLGSALYQLRRGSELIIWVDAICINQRDNGEKSEQVQRMFSIYQKAANVVVWLGPTGIKTDTGIDLITDIGSDFEEFSLSDALASEEFSLEPQLTARSKILKQILRGTRLKDDSGKPTQTFAEKFISVILAASEDPSPLNGICELCARPYWTRSWIVQEYRAARSLQIMCGSRTVLPSHFWLFVDLYMALLTTFEQFIESTETCTAIKSVVAISSANIGGLHSFMTAALGSDVSLSTRLRSMYIPPRAQASDPRDRIFAHLGSVEDNLGLEPNYEQSTELVFTIATMMLLANGNIDLLNHCYSRNSELGLSLPSWAIDWTASFDNHLFYESPGFFHAYFQDQPEVDMIDVSFSLNNTQGQELQRPLSRVQMHIKGFRIGSVVVSTSTAFDQTKILDDSDIQSRELWRNVLLCHYWLKHVVLSLQQVSRNFSADALLNRLSEILYFMKRTDYRYGMSMEDWASTMNLLYSSPPELLQDQSHVDNFLTFQKCEMRHLNLRVLVIEGGYIGLTFVSIEAEDVAVIFYGADYPFILRPTNNTMYRLVGPIFVLELMRGEFLASPRDNFARTFSLI